MRAVRRLPLLPGQLNGNWLLFSLGALALLCYLTIDFLIMQAPPYMVRSRAPLFDRFPLWSALRDLPLPVPQTATTGLIVLLGALLLALAAYFAAVWHSRRTPVTRRALVLVVGFIVLFSLVSLLTLPTFNDDMYMYIQYARVFTLHHANPYTVPVSAYLFDPDLQFTDTDWRQTTLPYGPVWAYLSMLWTWLGGTDVVRTLLLFRVFLLAFSAANMFLIWKILARLNPAYRLTGLLCYAWNPLVVLAGLAHVEAVMLFFLLLSAYLYLVHRPWLGLVAVTLSALTKFVTGPLVLVYWVFFWRERSWRVALGGAALGLAVSVLTFGPFWEGWNSVLPLIRDPNTGSSGQVVSSFRSLLIPAFLLVVLGISLARQRGAADLVRGWALALLVFALFLMPHAYAWYLITLIGVISLVPSARLVALTFTICGAAGVTWMLELVGRYFIEPSDTLLRLIWWGPVLLALVWLYGRDLRQLPGLVQRQLAARRRSVLS